MKTIPLTQGKVTIVDDDMFEYLNQWKWYCGQGYAMRDTHERNRKKILMHREIIKTTAGMEVDHVNINRLDNRRCNLRNCSHAENVRNVGICADNTSGFKGVHLDRPSHKWHAKISVDGKRMYLGQFDTAEEAAYFYDLAALAYHSEFAKTNFGESK